LDRSVKKADSEQMEDQLKYGKISPEFFERVIYPRLGAKRNEILVGPSVGADNCVINVGGGQVLVATTDPLSYIPELGVEDSAWLSIHSIASDISTSGFHPQYAIFDLNLPASFKSEDFERYWNALSQECEKLGIAIVGGHTGRFEGIDSTIVGAGTMFSLGSSRAYLTTAGATKGHAVIITKGAAIETTGVLSRVFANKIQNKIGENALKIAQAYFKKISVVEDAFLAIKIGLKEGGVSAMHDATEGGVSSGLYELARASSLGIRVEVEKIPVSRETREICELFGINPITSLSEGTLVFSCNDSRAGDALAFLRQKGIEAAIVGHLVGPEEGIRMIEKDGKATIMEQPIPDPYWDAYYKAKHLGWT
jgi:hydrogenase expression/formation protein HypE